MDIDYGFSNEVFRLGWLKDPTLVKNCRTSHSAVAACLTGERQGAFEVDTQAIFVEPILRGLGWETLCHDQVDRAKRGKFPDYELFGKNRNGTNKRVAIVEVKMVGWPETNLRGDALDELRGYVREHFAGRFGGPKLVVPVDNEPAVCGAVTDGECWHIYDFHPDRYNLKCEFHLRDNTDVRPFVENLGRPELPTRLGL